MLAPMRCGRRLTPLWRRCISDEVAHSCSSRSMSSSSSSSQASSTSSSRSGARDAASSVSESKETPSETAPLSSSSSSSPKSPAHSSLLTQARASRRSSKFRLGADFVSTYSHRAPPFGFSGLGDFVYRRTYARPVANSGGGEPDRFEEWHECCERVVNGTYNMQKNWIEERGLGWSSHSALSSAEQMYDRMYHMKFLPPGRGLWAMGSPLTEERRLFAALNNCAFVSTDRQSSEAEGHRSAEASRSAEGHRPASRPSASQPYAFLMDASMLGVGVGFDTEGKHVLVAGTDARRPAQRTVVADDREGWVDALERVLDSHFNGLPRQEFDFSKIRPKGSPIRGFGGTASGPVHLEKMLDSINAILDSRRGKELGVRAIVDIMNRIGQCVVAGNVRRTAEIAFGGAHDDAYLDLKNYEKNPERAAFGWTSNNSVFAELGMDYKGVCDRVRLNGEPGFAWLENMRAYGRMGDAPDHKDHRARGGNPCLEQTLEDAELCCLVETFPHRHESLADFLRTLEFAFLYAKTVTLGATHWPETNRVTMRNRRIGCSMSGVAQFVASRGLGELKHWCEAGYARVKELDAKYSEEFAVPRSIKVTSVKPSGTVSLLAGATAGCHWPISRFYMRNVRVAKDSPLVPPLREAGYPIEDSVYDNESVVIGFPIDNGPGIRSESEVSMWEKLQLAAFLQRHWADNQVSCTVDFDPETEGAQLEHALDYFQYQLKGISFLPRTKGVYEQMPYAEISEDEYKRQSAKLKAVNFRGRNEADFVADKFCDSGQCDISTPPPSPSSSVGDAS